MGFWYSGEDAVHKFNTQAIDDEEASPYAFYGLYACTLKRYGAHMRGAHEVQQISWTSSDVD